MRRDSWPRCEHGRNRQLGGLSAMLGRDLLLGRGRGRRPTPPRAPRISCGSTAGPEPPHGAELRVATEHDVGSATGHVRGDGHGGLAAGIRDDARLALVVLGVEHSCLMPGAWLLGSTRTSRPRRCRRARAGRVRGARRCRRRRRGTWPPRCGRRGRPRRGGSSTGWSGIGTTPSL